MRNPPSVVLYPMMLAIEDDHRFFVCRRNGLQEIVVHSELTAERAEQAVEVLNEQQELNDHYLRFYWRLRTKEDNDVLRRDWKQKYSGRHAQSYGFHR